MAESPRALCLIGGATTTAGSVVGVGATPGHRTPERAAAPPAVSLYAGLPIPGATFVDHSRMPEWELGPFEFPHTLLQRAERPPTPDRPWAAPAMVDAKTTTNVTSTVATPAASVGPVYSSYTGYMPSTGLAPALPV